MNAFWRNWTLFGWIKAVLAFLVGTVVVSVLGVIAESNVRHLVEENGWDTLLSRLMDNMPALLPYYTAWLAIGLLFGAAAAIWLVWAFPERLGQEQATKSIPAQFATLIGIVACVGIAIYGANQQQNKIKNTSIGFSQQQVDEKIAAATKPLQDKINAQDKTMSDLQAVQSVLNEQNATLKRYFDLEVLVASAQKIKSTLEPDSLMFLNLMNAPDNPRGPLGQAHARDRATEEWNGIIRAIQDISQQAYGRNLPLGSNATQDEVAGVSKQLDALIDRMQKQQTDLLAQLQESSQAQLPHLFDPREIIKLYQEKSAEEADQIVKDRYLGKVLTIKVKYVDLSSVDDVRTLNMGAYDSGIPVHCRSDAAHQIQGLKNQEILIIRGKLAHAGNDGLLMTECARW